MTALTPEDREALAAVALADWMATPVIPVVEAIVDRHVTAARAEEREWIAQAIEGSITAHRDAGNRAGVATLAPLPDLIRAGVAPTSTPECGGAA